MLSAMHIEREFEQSSFKQLSFDKFYHLLTFLSNNFPSDNLLGRIFVAQFSVFQYSCNRPVGPWGQLFIYFVSQHCGIVTQRIMYHAGLCLTGFLK